MDKHFKKFKTVYLIRTILLCAALGVSAGLLAVGIVLLSLKMTEISINAGFYVLIGLGAAALVGVPLFFILRLNDAKVAKKLDDGYSLDEKIQTMVEYSGTEGELVAIQRDDALGRLSALKVKGLSLKKTLIAAAAAVVALALFITSIVIPARAKEIVKPPEEEYKVTEVQLVALQQLKEDVERSSLEDGQKNSVVVILDGLYDVLGGVKQESVMRSSVLSAVAAIDDALAGKNTYIKISTELKLIQNEHLTSVSDAIVAGVSAYRTPNSSINTLARVNEIAQTHDAVIAGILSKSVEPLVEGWSDIFGTELAGSIEEFCETFSAFFENSEYGDSGDGLYASLNTFNEDLSGVAQTIRQGGSNAAAIMGFIKNACDSFSGSASRVLGDQTYVCMMDEFVRTRLAEIFNLRITNLPLDGDVIPPDIVVDPDDKNPDDTRPGGNGGQDVLLGSDDLVYSPADDDHVKYAKVINAYYAEMMERIMNGEADEELAENLRNYFQILLAGIEENSGNEDTNNN